MSLFSKKQEVKRNVTDRLIDLIRAKSNPTVVGLDTHVELLPEKLQRLCTSGDAIDDALTEFNTAIIDEIAPFVPAVKIQSAYYEMYGHFGVRAMYRAAAYAMQKGLIVMADVKRNDIGSTASAYAAAYLNERGYDYITVNPYPGSDGISPFTDLCKANDKGIFVLCRMSNPSAAQIQNLKLASGETLYERIGGLIEEWGGDSVGKYGYSSVGAVVGATNPDEAIRLRELMPHTFFLVPGYGAQGGSAANATNCFDAKGNGAIVNSSRGIIGAYLKPEYNGMTYFAAAKEATLVMQEDLSTALVKAGKYSSKDGKK